MTKHKVDKYAYGVGDAPAVRAAYREGYIDALTELWQDLYDLKGSIDERSVRGRIVRKRREWRYSE